MMFIIYKCNYFIFDILYNVYNVTLYRFGESWDESRRIYKYLNNKQDASNFEWDYYGRKQWR